MARPRVLLDEDVPVALGEALRGRGHGVIHAYETELGGRDDAEILARAVSLRRAVLTHNVSDYMRLATEYGDTGRHHFGVILAAQVRFGVLLARASRLLSSRDAESFRDAVVWLVD